MKNRVAHIYNNHKNDVALLLLPCIASTGLLAIDVNCFSNIFRFWIYYFVAVVPLSYIFSTILLKNFELSFFQKIALGYVPTVVISSIGYFALESIGLSSFLIGIPCAGIIWLIRENHKQKSAIKAVARQSNLSFCIGLSVIYICASIALFSYFTITTLPPGQGIGGNIYEDTLWTVGNTWSILKNGFPAQDLRFSEVPLGYHIGQNIYYAFISKVTTVNPLFLHLRIAPYFDLFFLCAALSTSSTVFLRNKERSSWVVLIPVLFSATEITSFKAGGSATYHEIYTNPISFAFGFGSFLVLMILLSQKYFLGISKREFPFTFSLILFTLSVSTKGIVGILVPGSIVALLIVRWILKKINIKKEDLLLLLGMSAVVLALKLTIFDGSGGWLVPPQIEVSPVAIHFAAKFGIERWVSNIYFVIGPISRSFRFLFHIFIWSWTSIALIVGLLAISKVQDKGREKLKNMHIGMTFIGVCGFLYGINIMDNYWANLYYYKYSLAIIALALGFTAVEIVEILIKNAKPLKATNLLLLTGAVSVSIPSGIDLERKINYILKNQFVNKEELANKAGDQKTFLSKDEYDGLIWMQKNINPKSIIATNVKDKAALAGDYVLSVWFNYSTYTGLQFYNEGDEYNQYQVRKVSPERWLNVQNLLSASNYEESIEAWKLIDADYLLLKKGKSQYDRSRKYLGKTVFENRGIQLIRNPRR